MDTQKIAESIIYPVVEDLWETFSVDESFSKSLNFKLFGSESVLDSMSLVSLIVSIEEKIQDDMDITLTLANEKSMSRKNSPFLSIETLATYIVELIEEQKNG